MRSLKDDRNKALLYNAIWLRFKLYEMIQPVLIAQRNSTLPFFDVQNPLQIEGNLKKREVEK